MRIHVLLVGILVLSGCATGKMGNIETPLAAGAISKTTPIYVEAVSTKDTFVSGDKSGNAKRVNEIKEKIATEYAGKIVEHLKKRGYNAQTADGPSKMGLTISGDATKVENGSAAARYFVGMGAGSSNLFTNFTITDNVKKATLAKFQIIATSGGESGVGSYLDRFLNDGGKKLAEYVETGK